MMDLILPFVDLCLLASEEKSWIDYGHASRFSEALVIADRWENGATPRNPQQTRKEKAFLGLSGHNSREWRESIRENGVIE